jgi:hypothetical protein
VDPESSAIILCAIVKARNMSSSPALTDLRFDWCPDAYFFLKNVAVFVVMVATGAAKSSGELSIRCCVF